MFIVQNGYTVEKRDVNAHHLSSKYSRAPLAFRAPPSWGKIYKLLDFFFFFWQRPQHAPGKITWLWRRLKAKNRPIIFPRMKHVTALGEGLGMLTMTSWLNPEWLPVYCISPLHRVWKTRHLHYIQCTICLKGDHLESCFFPPVISFLFKLQRKVKLKKK